MFNGHTWKSSRQPKCGWWTAFFIFTKRHSTHYHLKSSGSTPNMKTHPNPTPTPTIKSRLVSKFWRCSSISIIKHASFGCMFLDPHLSVHHSFRYRCPFKTSKVTELRPLTQVSGEASMGNDMASNEWRYRSLKVACFSLSFKQPRLPSSHRLFWSMRALAKDRSGQQS